MKLTLGEIAKLIKGKVVGNENLEIDNIADPRSAKEKDLVFLFHKKFHNQLLKSKAAAFVVPKDFSLNNKPLIKTKNPRLALAKVLEKLYPEEEIIYQIHPRAVIGKGFSAGKNIFIGAFSFIGDHAFVGDKTVIFPHVYLGKNVKIGRNAKIYPQVSIYDQVQIGNDVIIHSGCVIGADGFGFELNQGRYYKIPQKGTVIIADDVELGANVTVDRAVFGMTKIGKGSKIDNGCQIAHNVIIGENCVVAAHTAIGGSVSIGDRVRIGGTVAIRDNVRIGSNVTIMGHSAVTKNIPDGAVVSGFPAQDHKRELAFQAHLRRGK